MRKWGYPAHLIAALVGGLGGYAVLLAAHQAFSYPGDLLAGIIFFFAVEAAFAITWRLRVAPNARATPAAVYALVLTAVAIPCGIIGFRGAFLGSTIVPEEGAPLIIPFLGEVLGFLLGFGLPMAPASWLVWRYLGQRS